MTTKHLSPWPSFSQEEADLVSRVLLSNRVNYWTGEEGKTFEREFASWVGTRYGIALANGTVALDLALKALDIGPGDEVVVTARTFVAPVSCIINAGARPVFADVDIDSQTMTAATIRPVLTARTRAILCVHLAGWPCDMEPIMALAREAGVSVIEDCAQAHGARCNGRMVGTFGDIGCWSFCQDKIITTGGEGGFVTTDDEALWSRMWSYKDHGKSWEATYRQEHPPGFRWLVESFGTNGRMTEMQAALGRWQLQRVGDWLERRAANAKAITTACRPFAALHVPQAPDHLTHAYYRLNLRVEPDHLAPGWSRDRIVAELEARGVPCQHGPCPEVYLEKAFDGTDMRPGKRLPVARLLGETSIVFLVHPSLTEDEIAYVCEAITEVLKQASR